MAAMPEIELDGGASGLVSLKDKRPGAVRGRMCDTDDITVTNSMSQFIAASFRDEKGAVIVHELNRDGTRGCAGRYIYGIAGCVSDDTGLLGGYHVAVNAENDTNGRVVVMAASASTQKEKGAGKRKDDSWDKIFGFHVH